MNSLLQPVLLHESLMSFDSNKDKNGRNGRANDSSHVCASLGDDQYSVEERASLSLSPVLQVNTWKDKIGMEGNMRNILDCVFPLFSLRLLIQERVLEALLSAWNSVTTITLQSVKEKRRRRKRVWGEQFGREASPGLRTMNEAFEERHKFRTSFFPGLLQAAPAYSVLLSFHRQCMSVTYKSWQSSVCALSVCFSS